MWKNSRIHETVQVALRIPELVAEEVASLNSQIEHERDRTAPSPFRTSPPTRSSSRGRKSGKPALLKATPSSSMTDPEASECTDFVLVDLDEEDKVWDERKDLSHIYYV